MWVSPALTVAMASLVRVAAGAVGFGVTEPMAAEPMSLVRVEAVAALADAVGLLGVVAVQEARASPWWCSMPR